jgi:LuxR family maltose regulon positive regulatory protein
MLTVAWPLCLAWQFDQVEDLMQGARSRLRELQRTGTISTTQRRELEGQLEFVGVVNRYCRDDVRGVDTSIVELLRQFDDSLDDLLKGSLYALLIAARREQFKLDDIDRNEAQSRRLIDKGLLPHVVIVLDTIVGSTLYSSGRTEAALKCLHSTLEDSLEGPHHGIPLHQMVALPLAGVHYERNDLVAAGELIERYLPLAAEFGFADQLLAGWVTYARLLGRRGDLDGALRALDELDAIAMRVGFERVRLLAGAERIRFLEAGGQSELAASIGRDLGLPDSAEAVRPSDHATTLDEARALAWVRSALSQGRVDDAREVADQWRAFFNRGRSVRSLIRWQVLLTHLYVLQGDARAARRTLHETLTNAAAGRFIRTILDEGPAVGALVLEQPRVAGRALSLREKFEAEVRAAFESEMAAERAGQPLGDVMAEFNGSLNARERELLELVAARFTNREIGDRIGMSEASVKWSLQLIFDKIGVRKRSEAVERARRFGLIN